MLDKEHADLDLNSGQSTVLANAPRLSHRGLTLLLVGMCLVPTVTIGVLWSYLPPVFEGQLQGTAWTSGMPDPNFYLIPFRERDPKTGGMLHVQNLSQQTWTMLNVQINHFYQIYDTDPLEPGEAREYDLKRFITKTGAAFEMRYNPVKNVRVYARLPTKDRATFIVDFESTGTFPKN
jgi:hypothetical protein